jgi:hypothetical protein
VEAGRLDAPDDLALGIAEQFLGAAVEDGHNTKTVGADHGQRVGVTEQPRHDQQLALAEQPLGIVAEHAEHADDRAVRGA